METFNTIHDFVDDSSFERNRDKSISTLPKISIDPPLQNLINLCSLLPCCYTMQCCWGHFVYPGQSDPDSLAPLPESLEVNDVEYRLAYIAFCLQNSKSGRRFRDSMAEIVNLNSEYIQLCSADWFWEQRVNTYQLQVEPERFKHLDKAIIPFTEAKLIEKLKAKVYDQLTKTIEIAIRNG
ncbi:MAG: hypothetical protein KAR42_09805 [candidate division Zixibacteria bacterium]|nr:hypothetical protein [candidate division Zixibacteria bacterium]